MSAPAASRVHIPVLLAEVLTALAPRDGATYLDGTFGAGGYAGAILEAANCTVVGIDRDPAAIARGAALAERFPQRLRLVHGRFGAMADLLAHVGIDRVDGIVLDLGVSSPQIDEAERGFSFRFDGPLDMRMSADGPTAADLVNRLEEEALANLIYQLGEERLSRRVARRIVEHRPFTRTLELAEVIRGAVPRSKDGIDPATRTFQALRLAVNDELGEIDRGLEGAERLLVPEGRLVVVSFHSLEDRRVKDFLRDRSGAAPAPSRHLPAMAAGKAPSFILPSKKPVLPGDAEIRSNPRARSSKLRLAVRTAAPAHGPIGSAA